MATVQIHEMTDATTGYDKTSDTVRFKSADETTVDTSNMLTVPPAGEDWSYTKQLRFYVSVAPATQLEDLEAYTDGGGWANINVDYDTHTTFQTQTDSDISGTDLFSKTSGDAVDMDTYNTGPFTGTGYKGDFLRLQMGVTSSAGPGPLSAETLTFAYTES